MQPGILFDGVYKTKMMVEPNPETLNSQAGCCFGSADPVVPAEEAAYSMCP